MSRMRRATNEDTAFCSLLWGDKPHYILEAMVSGFTLMQHCEKKRILFVDQILIDSGWSSLLKIFWDVRVFEHYDAGSKQECTQVRLRNVWSKMLPWKLLAGKISVALMLDTDTLVRRNIDYASKNLTHADRQGAYRGAGEWSLTTPRPSSTIKAAENQWGKVGPGGRNTGGDINVGAVLMKPNVDTFNEMSDVLRHKHRPPDRTCAEQDFWPRPFAAHWHERLGELDASLNFQTHQPSLSVPDRLCLQKLDSC